MLKKILLTIPLLLLAGGMGIYLYQDNLKQAAYAKITENMFVADDSDNFDPGLAIGEAFPALRTSFQGQIISDMGQFIADKGMIFIANRSVDW